MLLWALMQPWGVPDFCDTPALAFYATFAILVIVHKGTTKRSGGYYAVWSAGFLAEVYGPR